MGKIYKNYIAIGVIVVICVVGGYFLIADGQFLGEVTIPSQWTSSSTPDAIFPRTVGEAVGLWLQSASTQCLQVSGTGVISGTGAACGSGSGGGGNTVFELFNNVGIYATTTGKSLFVRGALSATSSTALFEVAGDVSIHDLLTVSRINATSTVSTSTIGYGLDITNGGIDINLPSCSEALETDSNGVIVCGSDATAAAGTSDFGTFISMSTGKNLTASSSIDLAIQGELNVTGTGTSTNQGNEAVMGILTVGASASSTIRSTTATSTLGGLNINHLTVTKAITQSGGGTSTYTGGIYANALRFNQPSCNTASKLITDSDGSIVCALEALDGAYTGTYDGNNFGGGVIDTGELIYGGSSGSFSELGAGTRGAILSMTTGGIPGWVSTSTFAHLNANNIFTGTGSTTFAGNVDVAGDVHADSRLTTDDILFVRGTGTSTFVGGVFANTFRSNLPSCDTLDTDSTGAIICGSDATGAGGSGQVDFELFNNVGQRATTTGKYFFVRGDLTSTSSQARFEVAGDAHIHDLLTVGYVTATGTATSTYTGGIFANTFRSNLPSCDSLDTDSTGAIVCGSDATGAGGSGQIDWELFNNVGQRATTTGKSLFVRGDYTSTTTQDRLEVAGRATVHHLLTVGYLTATSTVSTSTIAYGLNITNGGLDINLPSCTGELETDSNGSIICGTQDVTGDWTGTIDGNNFAGGAIGVGELIYGGSAGSFSELAAGTRGNVLMFGTGGLPIWQATSTLAWEGDTATTTFASGIAVGGGGLATSKGLVISGGVLIDTASGTSTFTGGISMNTLTTTKGITVNGSGTSTFTGGIFANTFRTNLPSCTGASTLDTDSTGAIVCGADADTTYTQANNLTLTGTVFGLKTNLFSLGDIYATTSSASLYASSTVQATGNLLGYLDVLLGGTTTPWGGVTIEQQAGKGFLKPIFVVGDSGTSTPFFSINQHGQAIFGTTTNVFSQGKSDATSTIGAVHMPFLVVDNGKNGTSTLQIGGVGNPACLRIRDADNGGYTYCKTENGAMQCSLTSC